MSSIYVSVIDGLGIPQTWAPTAARRISDGSWMVPHNREWSDEQLIVCGWRRIDDTPKPPDDGVITYTTSTVRLVDGEPVVVWEQLVRTPRPADDDTTTHDRSVELIAGVPTVVWTPRPWSADELTARQQDANRTTIDTAITAALAELSTLVAAGDVPTVPAGTMTSAQLSNAMRTMRDAVQANRAGAQRVAATLKQTIRLVRGDFDAID